MNMTCNGSLCVSKCLIVSAEGVILVRRTSAPPSIMVIHIHTIIQNRNLVSQDVSYIIYSEDRDIPGRQ